MILVRLMGGLGNQMFQYAMARSLALKHRTALAIDRSGCAEAERLISGGLSVRPFGLHVFSIQGEILDEAVPQRVIRVRKENRLRRAACLALASIFNRLSDRWRVCIRERRDVGFDPTLLRLPDDVMLQGYFPSYKYFRAYADVIREDFTFCVEPDATNRRTIHAIQSANSVSVHVRRGDYVSSEKAQERFGACSLCYYKTAMAQMAEVVEDPCFFCFTNDPVYVKAHLQGDYSIVYVDHNTGGKSYEDMRLMSLCRHNIIANSSFGWWGGWLNRNPDKIVMAPSPAFEKDMLTDDDFYPDTWIRMPKI